MTHTPDSGTSRGQELRLFLSSRRERLRPEDFGLPSNPRIPGLSQEQVAVLTGVGSRWYGMLERGLHHAPDVARLNAVADALRLSEADRELLFALATPHESALPAAPPTSLTDRHLAIVDSLEGIPALVHDRSGHIHQHTRTLPDWLGEEAVTGERNLLLWLFTDDAAKRIRNIDKLRTGTAAHLRLAHALHPADGAVASVIARIRAADRGRRVWDRSGDVPAPELCDPLIDHPIHGEHVVPTTTTDLGDGLTLLVFHVPRMARRRPARPRTIAGPRRPSHGNALPRSA